MVVDPASRIGGERMIPMTREELAGLRSVLGAATPAAPELVADTVKAARIANRVADRNARHVLLAVPPIVARLLNAETDRVALRSTVGRLVVANQRGDDYSLSDLAFELERAGIDLKEDYAEADDLARAEEQEALL
ncbi:hypothetical protein CTZ28_12445 [Streptomyces shenzhenensis]|uniref:Uncharacterized protein n=2 Tax=Streptomyces shenzhenensis TaxID=943815 RepID=A0A3M0I9P9_9ACTN|nr:hypothetical protein CTZ28_12445 [Streptomyces shenzhenensis]